MKGYLKENLKMHGKVSLEGNLTTNPPVPKSLVFVKYGNNIQKF